jgi:hypothetical protein
MVEAEPVVGGSRSIRVDTEDARTVVGILGVREPTVTGRFCPECGLYRLYIDEIAD